MIDGQPFVHDPRFEEDPRALDRRRAHELPQNNPTIVIDPGHGGEDAGTKSVLGNRYEREFTLDWARRLASLLTANGWQVFLTRSNDTPCRFADRIAFAEEHAGLF